jgi:hydroxymethylglutaryl-CoA lyase
MSQPGKVRIVEVSPRDGLQNEKAIVDIGAKLALIDALADAGAVTIEAGSFVSPKWVPQMADTDQVFARLTRRPGVTYPALVPNLQGFERALAAGVEEVAVFAAASETFSRKNTNGSIAEVMERFEPVLARAQVAGVKVRGYISCVLGCP